MDPTALDTQELRSQITDLARFQAVRASRQPVRTVTNTVTQNLLVRLTSSYEQVLASGSAGAGWTTLDVTSYVPNGRTQAYLRMVVTVAAGESCKFEFRPDSTQAGTVPLDVTIAGKFTTSEYELLNVNGTSIDYKITVVGNPVWSIILLGYL